MFTLKSSFGEHQTFGYDTDRYKLKEMIETLYGTDLYSIQSISTDFLTREKGAMQDVESDLHKRFYSFIKSSDEFKKVYCSLVRDIAKTFFGGEEMLIYQSFPSIRFQFVGNTTVPPHCDSDSVGKHPIGERNFLLPITRMTGTTRLFLESSPGKADFQGIDMDYGDILYFNGNKCIHYNQTNTEPFMRISFDFRILKIDDYLKYTQTTITQTNPRDPEGSRKPVKMIVGGYYQCMNIREPQNDLRWISQKTHILQTRPSFDTNESLACSSYFSNGDPFLTEFKETEKLENMIKKVVGTQHCFMTPSGTSAIITALIACNIGVGDHVIVPDYTMIATVNAVRAIGAVPIIIDVSNETYTMDISNVRSAFTPSVKAVIHVSLNNRSRGIESIVAFCKEKSIFLIEDAAQSLGCTIGRKSYGTFGDIGCFSLSSPKIITTGQGGFLVTNNGDLAAKILKIKNFGRTRPGTEEYDSFGLNFKFTDIQAVIGISQLTKLPERIERMHFIYQTYFDTVSTLRTISMMPKPDDEWIPWFIDIELDNRETLMVFLAQHGVSTRITYPSVHSILGYTGSFPNTDHISKKGVFLPTHFCLTNDELFYICTLLRIFDLNCAQKIVGV